MILGKSFLNNLYLICATLNYNSERIDPLEKVLKDFLLKQPLRFDLKEEMKKQIERNMKDLKIAKGPLLKSQSSLLSFFVFPQDAIKYTIERFSRYSDIFKRNYGFDFELIWLVPSLILKLLEDRKKILKFKDEVYAFKNKKEYGDPSFISIPVKKYLKKWKKVITFNINDLLSILPNKIVKDEIRKIIKVLDLLSFEVSELRVNKNLRFQEKPILKWNKSLIILNPHYLIRNLPQRCELLLRRCKGYSETKGKDFENMALSLLEKVPFSTLYKNIKYSGFELDGLLNLRNSSWFVECTSHPPSIKSLLGDEKAIDEDIRKTVEKCETQALRAIDHCGHPSISKLDPKSWKGILIILEGIYPSLNSNNLFQYIPQKSDIPRYVINYFDLQLFIRQPQIDFFEEYLFWRTQRDMPIISPDETDYWTYFIKMKYDTEYKEIFKMLQQRQFTLIYIGDIFTSKPHLRLLAKDQLT